MNDKNRVCPVELSGGLDNVVRRWLQNPSKLLRPYVVRGMTALDFGCGPGFFTMEMAKMVGKSGRVIACDLQDGMLQKLRGKITGSELEGIITLHKCPADRIGVTDPVDFVLIFYMLHEVPDQEKYLKEMAALLKPKGKILLVEPPFHVSKSEFETTLQKAKAAQLTVVESPKVFMGRTAVLTYLPLRQAGVRNHFSGKEEHAMPGTIIYYFSATGNSLVVARAIAEKLGDTELVPMVHQDAEKPLPGTQRVGLVFPVYVFGLPLIVARFIKKLRIPNDTYVFAVAAHGGMPSSTP